MQVLIDGVNKHIGPVLSAVGLAILTSIWAVFVRPQLVMASDLATVADQVEEVNSKVDKLASTVGQLVTAQAEARIDYLQDRIRELAVKERAGQLTSDEAYRLSDYRDRLEQAKLSRGALPE